MQTFPAIQQFLSNKMSPICTELLTCNIAIKIPLRFVCSPGANLLA